ncbi:MAG TPA: ABC transporter permease subunit [Actinocrinis sp.]|jgi:ABC-type transport system involved in multi-copper enzyme maturation permease subunit|uniref:ABC transporter permease subunit n=1 Tax=Actinocrinis sp. TaxID=1920516 RepID=UPI002DDD8C64|nr:ABC transporter permease subunit [Actinocrinis sp.]HEV3173394.1 ABC transporter permease subunit [Actinocrinis sp.]
MIWLTWRQFRTQTFAVVAILAAAAVYLLITGTQLRHSYTTDLASCQPQNSCLGLLNALQDQYSGPQFLAEFFVMAAPALIGIFWGAPLIAGELERGTHHMVWNQSVTRTRWLAVKLAALALVSVVTAGLLSLLITWWASPLDTIAGNRWGTRAFNARDIAPLGYAVFAFALGVTLGLLLRRTVPAMAATLAVFIAVQVLMTAAVRPNLLPATTTTVPINQTTMSQAERFDRSEAVTGPVTIDLPAPPGAWALSQTPALNSAGQPIQTSEILNCWSQMLAQGPPAFKGASSGFGSLGTCLAPLDLHVDITYQPAGRYWPLQWLETAVYAVLAALLAAACFWRVRRLRG